MHRGVARSSTGPLCLAQPPVGARACLAQPRVGFAQPVRTCPCMPSQQHRPEQGRQARQKGMSSQQAGQGMHGAAQTPTGEVGPAKNGRGAHSNTGPGLAGPARGVRKSPVSGMWNSSKSSSSRVINASFVRWARSREHKRLACFSLARSI